MKDYRRKLTSLLHYLLNYLL